MMPVSTMFPVNAGMNTLVIQMARTGIASTVDAWFGEAKALFTSFYWDWIAARGFGLTSAGTVDPLPKTSVAP